MYKFRELDRICKRELGEAPNGKPMFRWMHSNDPEILRKVRIGWDTRCLCGLNRRVHVPQCSGVVVPIPKIELRNWPDLEDQWVMARWRPPKAARDPRTGYYVPVSYWGPNGDGAPIKYIALDTGMEPNLKLTERFVDSMKRELEKRMSDVIDEGNEIVDKKNREQRATRLGQIQEIIGLYNAIPGKRGDSVSLPDPTLQAKGDAAPALRIA